MYELDYSSVMETWRWWSVCGDILALNDIRLEFTFSRNFLDKFTDVIYRIKKNLLVMAVNLGTLLSQIRLNYLITKCKRSNRSFLLEH